MAKLYLLLAILLFLIPSAGANFFTDFLTQNNSADLSHISPNKTLQGGPGSPGWEDRCEGDSQQNCIFGWLDIVGFQHAVRLNGVDYVGGDPASSAIVQYKTYIRINSRHLFERWIYDLDVFQSNGYVVAKLTATAVLYSISSDGYIDYLYETKIFYDSIAIPAQYPKLSNNTPVYINIYNYTFEPKTTIRFETNNAIKTTVSYHNNSLTHNLLVGHIEYDAKGVPFTNMTHLQSWDREGDQISHIADEFMINGTAGPRDIIVQAASPFETVTLSNFSIETVEPSPPFNAVFLPFLLVLSVMWITTSKILRSIKL